MKPAILALLPLLLPVAPAAAPARPVSRLPFGQSQATETPRGVWPLDPHEVVRRFDPPDSQWGSGHRGVDLRGRPAEPVRAALAGVIRFAGVLAGRGVVVVGHGDTRTTYEPVTATVHVGQRVTSGQLIGTLTAVQSHCRPAACLHWGWLRGAEYLDPLLLVGEARPIRLLPLWK